MPYLTLTHHDGETELVEIDANSRLLVSTGQTVEFGEHGLQKAEYSDEKPKEKKK